MMLSGGLLVVVVVVDRVELRRRGSRGGEGRGGGYP